MKRILTAMILISLLTGCEDQISSVPESDRGSVTGRIYPNSSKATVGIYQGVVRLVSETTIANDGTFLIEEVQAGNYLLRVSASGFGSLELENINVGKGYAADIGELVLNTLPWPIHSITLDHGNKNFSVHTENFPVRDDISIVFRLPLDIESFEEAVTISPEPPKLNISHFLRIPEEEIFALPNIFIDADWDYVTEYTIKVDTSLKTELGRKLEFPLIRSFTVEPFRFEFITPPSSGAFNTSFGFTFNGNISESEIWDNVTISPGSIERVQAINNNHKRSFIFVSPVESWSTGDNSITVKSSLMEDGGTTLSSDTTIMFEMDWLSVGQTIPENRERDVQTSRIHVSFNTLLDSSNVRAAFSISPEASYVAEINPSWVNLFLSSPLQSTTTYTVSVDTTLLDIWGNPLGEHLEFSFTTK